MLRIPLAGAAFVGSISAVGSMSNWGHEWQRVGEFVVEAQTAQAVQHLQYSAGPGAVGGALLFMVAVFLLALPARRAEPSSAKAPAAVESREHQSV